MRRPAKVVFPDDEQQERLAMYVEAQGEGAASVIELEPGLTTVALAFIGLIVPVRYDVGTDEVIFGE